MQVIDSTRAMTATIISEYMQTQDTIDDEEEAWNRMIDAEREAFLSLTSG